MKLSILMAASLAFGAAGVQAEERIQTDLYTVEDGYKVDEKTLQGFKTWRSAQCDRCHGPNQEGLVGPSLIESMKVLTREEFNKIVTEGRMIPDQGKLMPAFKESKIVMDNLDDLYNYLKGRSDGAIKRAKVEILK